MYMLPDFSSLSIIAGIAFPITWMRGVMPGLNAESYGLRIGPPATSNTTGQLYDTTLPVLGFVHEPLRASARFFGHNPCGNAIDLILYPGTAESIASALRAICS